MKKTSSKCNIKNMGEKLVIIFSLGYFFPSSMTLFITKYWIINKLHVYEIYSTTIAAVGYIHFEF